MDAMDMRGSVEGWRAWGLRPGRWLARGAALALLIAGLAGPSHAGPIVPGPISDPQGDFLPSYTGPIGSDLDVRMAQVLYNAAAGTLTFTAQLWGAVGQTAGRVYAWGIDRGLGTEVFQNPPAGQPKIGPGSFSRRSSSCGPT